jgi:hypothetical protein
LIDFDRSEQKGFARLTHLELEPKDLLFAVIARRSTGIRAAACSSGTASGTFTNPANDTTFAQVIGRNFYHDMITRKYTDVVTAHLAGKVRKELVSIVADDTKGSVRETLLDNSVHFDSVFAHTFTFFNSSVTIRRSFL